MEIVKREKNVFENLLKSKKKHIHCVYNRQREAVHQYQLEMRA